MPSSASCPPCCTLYAKPFVVLRLQVLRDEIQDEHTANGQTHVRWNRVAERAAAGNLCAEHEEQCGHPAKCDVLAAVPRGFVRVPPATQFFIGSVERERDEIEVNERPRHLDGLLRDECVHEPAPEQDGEEVEPEYKDFLSSLRHTRSIARNSATRQRHVRRRRKWRNARRRTMHHEEMPCTRERVHGGVWNTFLLSERAPQRGAGDAAARTRPGTLSGKTPLRPPSSR